MKGKVFLMKEKINNIFTFLTKRCVKFKYNLRKGIHYYEQFKSACG